MPNKYPGYCKDCGGDVPAGHGELKKEKGRWVVSCGNKAAASAAKVKQNPKPKVAPGTLLNSPVIAQPQVARLSDARAAEILAEIGSEFVRPLPAGEPTLGIGYTITAPDTGKELSVGTCGEWVGIATDFGGDNGHLPPFSAEGNYPPVREYAISLIDGTILESGQRESGGRSSVHGISYWTRMLGAPVKMEAHGKNSVAVGDVERKGNHWYMVVSVDKPYYLSAEAAEDMDMFSRGGGWGTPYEMREITEPRAEREKREAQEKAETEQAAAIIASVQASQQEIAGLLPAGIRPLTSEESDAAWASVHQWKQMRDGGPVEPAELVLKREAPEAAGTYDWVRGPVGKAVIAALGSNWDRLPAMPGNEGGLLGWTHIYRWRDRYLVYFLGRGYDSSPSLQGISALPEDAPLLADFAQRRAIKGYRYDPALWELLVTLDAEGKLYGKYAYFGGTPFSPHGPHSQGAYCRESNRTAAEKRAGLIERFQAIDDPRSAQALDILGRDDSITEIR